MEFKPVDLIQRKIVRFPPIAVLILALSLTTIATYFAYLKSKAEDNLRIDRVERRISSAIETRIKTYINALVDTRGLLSSDSNIDRTRFKKFVDSLELPVRYPGFLGIGYALRVPQGDLERHIQQVRNEGFKAYKVWPETPRRSEYYTIIYLEPFDMRNQRAFGFDMSSEPKRHAAMMRARDTGTPTLTDKVSLVQEAEPDNQKGFLIYVPFYEPGMPISTMEQRRAAIRGFIYSPFRANDFFNEIIEEENRSGERLSFEVFDGPQVQPENLIFSPYRKSHAVEAMANNSPLESLQVGIGEHEWTVTYAPLHLFHPLSSARTPWYIFGTGLLISFLIYLFARLAAQYNASVEKSETQMRLVTDALPVFVSYVDKDQTYRFTNRIYEEWFGQPINGKKVFEVLSSDIYMQVLPKIKGALSGKKANFELYVKHENRGSRALHGEYIPDVRADGSVQGFITLISDVTEQKQFQDKLQEERRISELTSEIGLSLRASLDLETVVQNVTDAATKLTSAQFGAFFYNVLDHRNEQYMLYTISGVDRKVFEKFPMPRNTKIFAPTFNGEHIVRFDDVTEHPDFGKNEPYFGMPKGHLPVRSYLAVPVISRSGEVLGGLFFGHSQKGVFTERAEKLVAGLAAQAAVAIDNAKLYSESQSINRIKDEFLATLSHELRTPLNVILGHAEILKMEAPPLGELSGSIEAIYRNAKSQHQLISDLLDVSAIITGKINIQPIWMSTGSAVRAAVESVRFASEAKGLSLVVEDRAPGCFIIGDPTRIQQVVWNLLSNAVKFTPKGGQVFVQIRNEKSKCVIEVKDTGIGIEPDFLPYVFDRFRQEDSSMTRRFGGLGLGLSIVRQLVELHGGTIKVFSEGKGKGATFTVYLPVAAAQVDVEPSEGASVKKVTSVSLNSRNNEGSSTASNSNKDKLSRLRVLVVDDEPDARDLVSRILRRAGAEVEMVASAKEGLEMYRKQKPNVVVSDIGMPEEDGISFIRRLRALEEKSGEFTPAVALTAYARDEERKKVLSAGYQMHLAKPIEAKHLVESILKIVREQMVS